MSTQMDRNDGNTSIGRELSGLSTSTTEPTISNNFKYSSISEYSYKDFQSSSHMHSFRNANINQEGNPESSEDDVETISVSSFDSMASAPCEQVNFPLFAFVHEYFRLVVIVLFSILQYGCDVHIVCNYAVIYARRSQAATEGAAEYCCHVQTGF